MSKEFRVEFQGDLACFTRPEFKVERVSYDVPTPSAVRGMLDAIYWHPGMKWRVDRIHVLNPIKFTSVRRNEMGTVGSASKVRDAILHDKPAPHLYVGESQQRATVMLRDVHYVVDAHIDMEYQAHPGDNPKKFESIAERRLTRGQCHNQPVFGCREFPAYFNLYEGEGELQGCYTGTGERDLGFMLFDMDYSDPENIMPTFFRAVMRDGVIRVPAPDSNEVLR